MFENFTEGFASVLSITLIASLMMIGIFNSCYVSRRVFAKVKANANAISKSCIETKDSEEKTLES
jgi:hypothetical protein